MNTTTGRVLLGVIALASLLLSACGGGDSGGSSAGGGMYYHFICNGDSECLATNFAGTDSGTSGDLGPGAGGLSGCNSLLHFGSTNWNIPPAQQWCDYSATLVPPGGALPVITDFTPATGSAGTPITITGSNFSAGGAGITVTVAGVPATLNSATTTQLVVTVVSTGNATGPIAVTTDTGTATSSASFTVVAVNPIGTAPIRKIAPGYTHTCAILADNSVKCWGSNDFAQLGDGTTAVRPGAVTVAGVVNPIDIAVGISFSCGIFGTSPGDAAGEVKCWGKGTSGQLGNNANADSVTPVTVASLSTASQISARANHVCTVLTNGQVMCWGDGGSGQLGDGNMTSSPVPVAVLGTGPDIYDIVNTQGQPASTKAFQVSTGNSHTCARVSATDGSAGLNVKCWGATNHGELGNGAPLCQVNTICDPKNPNPVPQYVSGVSSATQIAAGGNHTCAVLTSGQLRCWGEGDNGQLGNGAHTRFNYAVVVNGISGATNVSAGSQFSCASVGGSLKCWGDNGNGQLGDGTAISSASPVITTAVTAGSFDPATLMGGDKETCLKLTDETAYCFP